MKAKAPSIFRKEFIQGVTQFDYPVSLNEASSAAPWNVTYNKSAQQWVLRQKDSLDEPTGVFSEREAALLVAATLPAVDRPPLFRALDNNRLLIYRRDGSACDLGKVADLPDSLTTALDTAHSIISSPDSLAWFLMAASGDTLERAGSIVMNRMRKLSSR